MHPAEVEEVELELRQVSAYAVPWWVIVTALALLVIAALLHRRGDRG